MERKPKTYVRGISFREKRTTTGKTVINIYVSQKFLEFFEQFKDQRGGVSIDVWPLDVPDKFNNTHSLVLNDFVPQQKGEQQMNKASMQGFNKSIELPNDFGGDDLPFW